ncbi:threonine/homoserine/homoserine lactone efflux protein [Fontibacillus solani]|uniref:Threonine/homoserine/homoserine lactone efflux protein n=1 Tax=Fontibacillus solani TaxID=1572857 RepID=A0A7W3XQ26_9BACL|nr:threonine/homoserine/homoserine lactone efflux protein [Fontibacillus solani]
MNILISHFLLGLSLAAPIGPINAAQIDRGIRGGFLHAWLVGLGAMLADGVFMILVFFGVIHFLNIPFMRTFLLLSGFFILTYIGAESLIKARQNSIETRSNNEPLFKSFSAGFIMSISNPLSIFFG